VTISAQRWNCAQTKGTECVLVNIAPGRRQFNTPVVAAEHHRTQQFIPVGIPPDEDGSTDLQYARAAARSIGQHMTDCKVIVGKCTVPVGTADRVRGRLRRQCSLNVG